MLEINNPLDLMNPVGIITTSATLDNSGNTIKISSDVLSADKINDISCIFVTCCNSTNSSMWEKGSAYTAYDRNILCVFATKLPDNDTYTTYTLLSAIQGSDMKTKHVYGELVIGGGTPPIVGVWVKKDSDTNGIDISVYQKSPAGDPYDVRFNSGVNYNITVVLNSGLR